MPPKITTHLRATTYFRFGHLAAKMQVSYVDLGCNYFRRDREVMRQAVSMMGMILHVNHPYIAPMGLAS